MSLINSDCLQALKAFESNSVDSLVTDPPAGISFMGKSWDSDKGGRKEWVSWMTDVMRECLRVLKPGAHGFVWALPRTSHWTATALEDAGFEIRDVITHLFGQGFPKSLDISKAIDKAAGSERVCTKQGTPNPTPGVFDKRGSGNRPRYDIAESEDAQKWQGWGTALKPASEHWILVRKPCSEKTVAANVLKWGTGGLNIGASRISGPKRSPEFKKPSSKGQFGQTDNSNLINWDASKGRFPANLVLSHSHYCEDDQCDIECAVKQLDGQSGKEKASGASRFFYCAKISSAERNAGFERAKEAKAMSQARPNIPDLTGKFPDHYGRVKTGNFHPTVKPQKLMRYLCKLVTPPGGVVLDPFMGSGSTGLAAKSEGFLFIGIEKEGEYFLIAEKRVGIANSPTA